MDHLLVEPAGLPSDPYVEEQLDAVSARTCPWFQHIAYNAPRATCDRGCHTEPGCEEYGPLDDIARIEDAWLQGWEPGVTPAEDARSVIAALCRSLRNTRNELESSRAEAFAKPEVIVRVVKR